MSTLDTLQGAFDEQAADFAADHPGSRWVLEHEGDEEVRLAVISADFQGLHSASRYNMVSDHLDALPSEVRARISDMRFLTHSEWVLEPEQVLLTGTDPETGKQVDVTVGGLGSLMTFEYDAQEDEMELRLRSFAGTAVEEPTEDGFVLLRAGANGAAIGMRVPNYMRRFAVESAGGDLKNPAFIAPVVQSFLARAA